MSPAEARHTPPIRVGHVDDHPVLSTGLAASLREYSEELEFVGSGRNVEELLAGPGADADIVVLDITGVGDLVSNIARLRERGMEVLILTQEERAAPLRQAIDAGARGVLLKSDPPEAFVEALRDVQGRGVVVSGVLARALLEDDDRMVDLSPREIEVIEAIADGLTRKQAARALYIAVTTVNQHLSRAVDKYARAGRDTGNTAKLIREARRDGHLRPDG